MLEEKIIHEITRRVLDELRPRLGATCPAEEARQTLENGWVLLGVSARHMHVTPEHLEILYGPGHKLNAFKPLYQQDQYASEETVVLIGPRMRCLGPVRILGPVRKQSQIEISYTDAIQIGIMPPVRPSGDLKGTPGCIVVGPKGVVHLQEGVIRANRHVHIHTSEAKVLGLKDNDTVRLRVCGDRPTIYDDVQIRVHDLFKAECHLDTDDANAAGVTTGMKVQILKD